MLLYSVFLLDFIAQTNRLVVYWHLKRIFFKIPRNKRGTKSACTSHVVSGGKECKRVDSFGQLTTVPWTMSNFRYATTGPCDSKLTSSVVKRLGSLRRQLPVNFTSTTAQFHAFGTDTNGMVHSDLPSTPSDRYSDRHHLQYACSTYGVGANKT